MDRDALLTIARDISLSLPSARRAERLVAAVRRALPCDAAALLRATGADLVPVAVHGLSPDVLGRRFRIDEHPRLARICASSGPVRFGGDEPLPDPYDGLVGDVADPRGTVHACLGCPLRVDGELVGVLTADALDPRAFDELDSTFVEQLAALAGAALRTIELIEALERAVAREGLISRDLGREAFERSGSLLLGKSPAIRHLLDEIEMFGPSDLPVLVTGETGVGKELVVRMLHQRSARATAPLVYVNCAALPDAIAESELFGHVKGAFTGADAARTGKFGIADGASLLLDEVGELAPSLQAKLLRVLQEGELQRVGDDRMHHVDVRVFASTNRDLEAEVRAGRFRADLLHRLDVCRIHVPPLRERREDLPLLAGHFADRTRRRLGTGPIRFEPVALQRLAEADWPGNVRELENVVSRAVLRAAHRVRSGELVVVRPEDTDGVEQTPAGAADAESASELHAARPLREAVDDFQRRLIRAAIERHGGNQAAAARELGMGRANLHHLARRLGIR